MSPTKKTGSDGLCRDNKKSQWYDIVNNTLLRFFVKRIAKWLDKENRKNGDCRQCQCSPFICQENRKTETVGNVNVPNLFVEKKENGDGMQGQ